MKEKLEMTLGLFGVILYYAYSVITLFLPVFVVTDSIWLQLILFWVSYKITFSEIILWPLGLYFIVKLPQTPFSIFYYVMFAIGFIPMLISNINSLRRR